MSSSGLKLRDTRELLANPDQTDDPRNNIQLAAKAELGAQTKSTSDNQEAPAEPISSMSPSLAMANAEASPSPQEKTAANTEATTAQNTRKDNEPVPKKRRLLEATETLDDAQEAGHQENDILNDPDDILAQACFVVGIDSDFAESVVEEPFPPLQAESNGAPHRLPENYSYVRGVRPPPPGVPFPPRLRHPEEVIISRQIHPAFRPPSNGTYGMEVRPPYNPQYAVHHRVPVSPGESHRYYAVHHFRGRHPYSFPPGSIPPSHRPSVLRPLPPTVPHERPTLIQHSPPGYPYDPQRFPRPIIQMANHPQAVPLPHDTRREPPTSPANSDIRPSNPRHQEISYRRPSPHDLSNPVHYPPEQLSPNSIHHSYQRPGPIPIQPKPLVGSSQPLPDDCRLIQHGASERHIPRESPSIHPPPRCPLPATSPQELSCRNPFELPEPQERQNLLHVKESSIDSKSRDRPERDKSQSSNHSYGNNEQQQIDEKGKEITESAVSIDKFQHRIKSRRPREPPPPCVELIPLGTLSQDKKKIMAENVRKRIHALPQDTSSPKPSVTQGPLRQRNSVSQSESSHSTKHTADPTCSEADQLNKTRSSKIHNDDTVLPTEEDDSNKKNDLMNKIPRRSFKKRWLDKQESSPSKKHEKGQSSLSSEDKTIPLATQEFSKEKKETSSDISDRSKPRSKGSCIKESLLLSKSYSHTATRPIGPGQLHCLHSSSYQCQNRSASEPPTLSPYCSQTSTKRPASLPAATLQSRSYRVNVESQTPGNNSPTQMEIKEPELAKEKDEQDSAFIARLNLVLNDLISVPEATKLQDLTCPVDELLPSLVKRRGANPSDDPNPRQRLRKDFQILVKLCMPPNLIEDWGWDKCTPEEILDELIKVTNNAGVDSIIGNSKQIMNDVPRAFSTPNPSPQPPPPRPPPLLPSSPSHKPLPAPSQGLPSQPLPDIQPSATSSVPPQHHHGLPSHPLPLPSVVSSVPPQHHHVASPLNETYKPNAVTNITPVSPQNPPPSGHSAPVPHHSITPHQALSPKHPISPSAHSSMLPRHPNLSPHGPVPHSPNHPVLSPHHRLSASSQSPVSPYPSSQSSPSAHHPVPVSYHAMPPRHSIVHPPSHPPSSPHLPMPVASGHTPVPHRLPASHSSHYPETWASYHPMPVYTRQVSVSSSQSETTVSPEYIEDEVFSSKAQEPLTNTHISQANPQQYPTQQLTPKEQTHQGTSSTNNHPHQVHAVYPPGAYVRSPPNEVHSQHIPLSVLQYSQQGYNSQMTQQQPTSASHNSHIPSHYPTDPQHPPQVHNSVQYQRSAYPQPYALSYYHPNNHHPPPHPAQPAYRPPYRPNVPHHYPQSIPNHAYRPHIPPRNPVLQNQLRNPTSRGPVRFAPQPPVPLTTSDWNSADGERLEMTNSPIKPSA